MYEYDLLKLLFSVLFYQKQADIPTSTWDIVTFLVNITVYIAAKF